jgi:hypothetical protein
MWMLRRHKPVTTAKPKYQWGDLYAAPEVVGKNSAEFFFSRR